MRSYFSKAKSPIDSMIFIISNVKDYFLPYANGKLSDSRIKMGFLGKVTGKGLSKLFKK